MSSDTTSTKPKRQENHESEESLRATIRSLEARLAQIEEARARPVSPTFELDFRATTAKLAAERTKEAIAEMDRRSREADDKLLAGEVKYRVGLEGERRMTRIVGAGPGPAGEHEARGKYLAYFGILHTERPIIVEPANAAQPATGD